MMPIYATRCMVVIHRVKELEINQIIEQPLINFKEHEEIKGDLECNKRPFDSKIISLSKSVGLTSPDFPSLWRRVDHDGIWNSKTRICNEKITETNSSEHKND